MGRKVFRSLKDPMPTFALYDHRGDLIQSSMLHNKITLLNFIFTRCRVPTMCPAATERMKELLEKCKQAGVENIQVYSITLDPQYDSPGILNDYATNKGVTDEDFHFLTGPVRVIEDLKKHHGIETKDDETYGIYHTMMTVIIDPMKKVHYQIPGSHWSAEDYLNRILKLAQIEK
jgi:protein SCO1/2